MKRLNPTQPRKGCGPNLKCVGKACVAPGTVVSMPLRDEIQDDLDRAVYYLLTLPERVREVQQAAKAVLEADR